MSKDPGNKLIRDEIDVPTKLVTILKGAKKQGRINSLHTAAMLRRIWRQCEVYVLLLLLLLLLLLCVDNGSGNDALSSAAAVDALATIDQKRSEVDEVGQWQQPMESGRRTVKKKQNDVG